MKNTFLAIPFMITGSILRLNSRAIAWPANPNYRGDRANTEWAILENAINDISIGLFILGATLFAASLLINQIKESS